MVEYTDLMFYNIGTVPLKRCAADTLISANVKMWETNEFHECSKSNEDPNRVSYGSKFTPYCPPLLKLYLEAGGKSFPD